MCSRRAWLGGMGSGVASAGVRLTSWLFGGLGGGGSGTREGKKGMGLGTGEEEKKASKRRKEVVRWEWGGT